METKESINIWNNLPSYEKRAFAGVYITHQSNLDAWNKPFNELSGLKKLRVLAEVKQFSKIKDHCVR